MARVFPPISYWVPCACNCNIMISHQSATPFHMVASTVNAHAEELLQLLCLSASCSISLKTYCTPYQPGIVNLTDPMGTCRAELHWLAPGPQHGTQTLLDKELGILQAAVLTSTGNTSCCNICSYLWQLHLQQRSIIRRPAVALAGLHWQWQQNTQDVRQLHLQEKMHPQNRLHLQNHNLH